MRKMELVPARGEGARRLGAVPWLPPSRQRHRPGRSAMRAGTSSTSPTVREVVPSSSSTSGTRART